MRAKCEVQSIALILRMYFYYISYLSVPYAKQFIQSSRAN